MTKRFEQQYVIGQKRIEDVSIDSKCRDAFPKLVQALKRLCTAPDVSGNLEKASLFSQKIKNVKDIYFLLMK